MKTMRFNLHACGLVLLLLSFAYRAMGQTGTATVSGIVTDITGAVIVGAELELKSMDKGFVSSKSSNNVGIYVFTGIQPGRYQITVRKPYFKQVDLLNIILNTQDHVEQNFRLQLGSTSESTTVSAQQNNINTTDASVSTVVDRQFVANTPLNGRSFQDLLTLSPGVALVGGAGNGGNAGVGSGGEITVNGQRTEANYFTVDGVSVNTGTSSSNQVYVGAGGFSGSTPGETILGTTQSMVSIDALEEFRASTSTYSAEYGRTPGGQFSFTTRSGTNQLHGTAYDYFRNEVMDANNWFNNNQVPQIPRLPERQNDFGGTLGGPVVIPGIYDGKDKTFFFFSYEGLRLMVPQPFQQYSVPDITLRQQAPAALQPFLNAFPFPSKDKNGNYISDGLNDGLGLYNQAYSSPSTIDNVSVRVDHDLGAKLRLFGRYANTPSSNWTYLYPAYKSPSEINVRTLTLGATSTITPTQVNELRFNVTQNNTNNDGEPTTVGGTVPINLSNVPGPNDQPFPTKGGEFSFFLQFGGGPTWFVYQNNNAQRQYNLTDTYSWSVGAHNLKFGVDWRRLTTFINPVQLAEAGFFTSEQSVLNGAADRVYDDAFTQFQVKPVYENFSAFAQDEWRASRRLSLSLGLRWDVNPSPGNLKGPSPFTVDQVTNPATSKLAPAGTPLWKTDWHGFAPRIGLAYQLRQTPGHETVLRTGFGMFYDMGSTQGSQGFSGFPFDAFQQYNNVPFPLTSQQVTLPPINLHGPYSNVFAYDHNLKLPYTMEWNVALEQALGQSQSLTLSYVGASGRKLLTQYEYYPGSLGNQNFSSGARLFVTSNGATSDYDAFELKYQSKLSHGLQALASYTWSHSIDDATSNFEIFELLRSSSDFDIRHNFQAALTYDVPGSYGNPILSALLQHWGFDTRISASSALPVDIIGSPGDFVPGTQQTINLQPNLVPGQPIYVKSLQNCAATAGFTTPSVVPGGRIINICAFTPAPPEVEGNTPRNFARGFPAVQVNFAFRRDFPIHERLHMQFRAEAFNIFNHPNFGLPDGYLPDGPLFFGLPGRTRNSDLGGLNELYQSGGPRSLQLMLKLLF